MKTSHSFYKSLLESVYSQPVLSQRRTNSTQRGWLHHTTSSADFKYHSLYGPDVPLIQISAYPGRTKEQKEALAKAITNEAVEILKTNPQDGMSI